MIWGVLSPWLVDLVIADRDLVEYMPARNVAADAMSLAGLLRDLGEERSCRKPTSR